MTTLDGRLWVYRAADGYTTRQTAGVGDQHPMHVRFSPDGRQLAIGMDLSPIVRIYSSATLEKVSELTTTVSAGQRGLHVVDWSADGRHLIAGGEPSSRGDSPLYLWDTNSPQPARVLYRTQGRIGDVKRLADGAFAFVSSAPAVGVFDLAGQGRWQQRGQTMTLRLADHDLFRVSPDGARITVSTRDDARSTGYVFDVTAAPDQALSRVDARSAPSGRCTREGAGWRITAGDNGERFTVNDRVIDLDPRERARDWCMASDGAQLVLGSAWSIRSIDRSGTIRWRSPAPADVIVTNTTADGRYAVVALDDGTIRWYRMKDGAEVLAFLPHRNGIDWVAWIPSGYYMSSVNGDSLIGWHLNNGLDQTPDFYRAIQFERILYRPDVVREYFRTAGEVDVRTILADSSAFLIEDLRAKAPPRLAIRDLSVQSAGNSPPTARFSIRGSSASLPIQDYTVFVNDIPATPAVERTLASTEARSFERSIEIPLTAATNQVRVEAFNGQSMGVSEAVVDLPHAPTASPRGDLYLVAIGVNNFADTEVPDLRFAAQDAEELARFFSSTEGVGFDRVHVYVASDRSPDKPTRDTVRHLLTFIRAARAQDTVIVFLASHGLGDGKGSYYFVPSDVQMADARILASGTGAPQSLIPWQTFFDAMRGAAGRRLLIVDTCNASDMRGTLDVHTLAKRSAASRFALVAASRGNEQSQEYPARGHGLFTYGLLDALRNGVDPDGDQRTTLREAFSHAFEIVRSQRPIKALSQTPQLEAPLVLESTVLASSSSSRGAGGGAIPAGGQRQ